VRVLRDRRRRVDIDEPDADVEPFER
jgi:hypothetical protein